MVSTPGSVELVTELWLMEDLIDCQSPFRSPVTTLAMKNMIKLSPSEAHTNQGRKKLFTILNRVVKATGGKSNLLARMALSRMSKECTKGSQMNPWNLSRYLDVVTLLCAHDEHPIHLEFLELNSVTEVTRVLVAITDQTLASPDRVPELLDPLAATFFWLYRNLGTGDGFNWVTDSIQAGLLTAFVECSPLLSKMPPQDCEAMLGVIRDIVPQYLVYRSVILAAQKALKTIELSPRRKGILITPAKKVWKDLFDCTMQRLMTVHFFDETEKGQQKLCGNIKVNNSIIL